MAIETAVQQAMEFAGCISDYEARRQTQPAMIHASRDCRQQKKTREKALAPPVRTASGGDRCLVCMDEHRSGQAPESGHPCFRQSRDFVAPITMSLFLKLHAFGACLVITSTGSEFYAGAPFASPPTSANEGMIARIAAVVISNWSSFSSRSGSRCHHIGCDA